MKTVIKITAIEKDAAEVMFSDGTVLVTGYDHISRYGLKLSENIDDETFDQLIDDTDRGRCYESALRYLEFRPRTESELRLYLLSKRGYSTAVVERTIQRLKANGLLNDKLFAQTWVSERIKFKPRSRLLIERELRQKGVSPEDIGGATDDIDDFASAYQAGIKKARLLNPSDRLEFYRRLAAYLGRRGYSDYVVRSVVNRIWEDIT